MRLVTYRREGTVRLGLLMQDWVLDVNRIYAWMLEGRGERLAAERAAGEAPAEIIAFLTAGDKALAVAAAVQAQAVGALADSRTAATWQAEGLAFPLPAVRLMAPVPNPGKVVCAGLNYKDHAAEIGAPHMDRPVLFTRFAQTIVGHGHPVRMPRVSSDLDYEGELMIVIGKPGRYIKREDAFSHVAGYTIFNDVSVRDYQAVTTHIVSGKNFDGTGPMGPALVLTDELPDPSNLALRTLVDGEVMQSSNTNQLIFDVPYLVSYISEFTTLMPGDVIATGTPGGVGFVRKPPRWLKVGETVAVEIEGIGRLENPIVAE